MNISFVLNFTYKALSTYNNKQTKTKKQKITSYEVW